MKKILFICPKFFNYETSISEELSRRFEVDYWDERPRNSIVFKILLRLKQRYLIQRIINNYYERMLIEVKSKSYDYVMVVNPEAADQHVYSKLKKSCLANNNNCKFVLYLWDSVKNKPNVSKLFGLFDKVSTFDDKDAIQYGLSILPLFYTDKFDCSQYEVKKQEYDLCFIGTAHSNRIQLVEKITSLVAPNNNYKIYTFFYFHNRFLFLIKKLFGKACFKQKVSFEPLMSHQVVDLMRASRVVIDINHPSQHGLTMRTIESIGLNKKLITTNENIKNYDFYDERFIYVYSAQDARLPNGFIDEEDVNYKNRDEYSLKCWIEKNLSGFH